MSSHGDDHLDKEEVVARVLDVVKSFPKVDPAKVLRFLISPFSSFLFFLIVKKGLIPRPFSLGSSDNAHI